MAGLVLAAEIVRMVKEARKSRASLRLRVD
jgi:hypothetical protein